ncbi:MAG TPA: hypothetical protein VKY85_07800 [Candidatus Angelobacter sp.]|nr:hypothetical protein [Candidatus Angelobacter sp.]
MNEHELQMTFPDIAWRSPLLVMFGKNLVQKAACRYCIVQRQLKPGEIHLVSFHNYQQWQRHIFAAHGLGKRAEGKAA